MGASEAAKTTIDLDVNTDKISSDIRSAVENAGNQAEGALKVDMEVNEEQLVSKIREAINSLTSGDEPVKVNLQVNKESLQEDLNLVALTLFAAKFELEQVTPLMLKTLSLLSIILEVKSLLLLLK